MRLWLHIRVSIPNGFSSSLQQSSSKSLDVANVFVSIPNGFSSSLQLKGHYGKVGVRCSVSIPNGFSSSLQRKMNAKEFRATIEFQSLMGFQARCNYDGGI